MAGGFMTNCQNRSLTQICCLCLGRGYDELHTEDNVINKLTKCDYQNCIENGDIEAIGSVDTGRMDMREANLMTR